MQRGHVANQRLFVASAIFSLALRRFSSVSPRTQLIWARATRMVKCYPSRWYAHPARNPRVGLPGTGIGAVAGPEARQSPSDRFLDEAVFFEPLLGHLVFELSLHIDLGVQLLQLLCGQFLGDGGEDLLDLRVLVHQLLVHVERGIV